MKAVKIKDFKKTLSKFATGITVVSTKYKSDLYGKTINSFASLSLSPPLILFSLDIKSSKLNIFKKSKHVSINILNKKQKNLSDNFAKKNPIWDKVEFSISNYGNPVFKNCVANLECKITDKILRGDHIIFICKVIKVNNDNTKKPLVYFNSKYLD